MKKISIRLFFIAVIMAMNFIVFSQQLPGIKTTIDITVDNKGGAICQYSSKYNAAMWDNFQQTTGKNTSILKNQLIRAFPKEVLSNFNYTQDDNERTNKVTFKIDGMMSINKNGKWTADLDQKDPDITKVSETEFLLMQDGNTLKIHLPAGTTGAKVEKDSFGKAQLTYPATEGGMMGNIFLYIGIAAILGGSFLVYRNRNTKPAMRTIYEPAHTPKTIDTSNVEPATIVSPNPAAAPQHNVTAEEVQRKQQES